MYSGISMTFPWIPPVEKVCKKIPGLLSHCFRRNYGEFSFQYPKEKRVKHQEPEGCDSPSPDQESKEERGLVSLDSSGNGGHSL